MILHLSQKRKGADEPEINHVSINARDLQESVDFYIDLLGAEPIPTPNFGLPVQWLALGRTQLHLFERDLTPTSHHHLGITVDDVEPVYRAAERRGASTRGVRQPPRELPGDVVQLYVRDPAGNLVEIDHHGVDRLPEDLARSSRACGSFHPQTDEQMRRAPVRRRWMSISPASPAERKAALEHMRTVVTVWCPTPRRAGLRRAGVHLRRSPLLGFTPPSAT